MRKIEDILKEMHDLGFEPDTIDQDINELRSELKDQISMIDDGLTTSETVVAFEMLYRLNKKHKITGPIVIGKTMNGGISINEGNIATNKGRDVQGMFRSKLSSGDQQARKLNNLLCGNA